MPPAKPANPTNKGESVSCSASQPTATWYIQKAELVASVPSRSIRNAGRRATSAASARAVSRRDHGPGPERRLFELRHQPSSSALISINAVATW